VKCSYWKNYSLWLKQAAKTADSLAVRQHLPSANQWLGLILSVHCLEFLEYMSAMQSQNATPESQCENQAKTQYFIK